MNYSPERAGTPDREHVHRDAHTTLFFTQPGVPMKSRDELDKYELKPHPRNITPFLGSYVQRHD